MHYPIKNYDSIPHKIQSYLIGFILSIILTFIPFLMVINNIGSETTLFSFALICAIIQIIVHLIYFLHLNRKSEGGWNFIAVLFTTLVISVIIIGSLWIMWHLNYNMEMSACQ
ncbi:cytochrome o ubiquinol oxidase subunit IV [Candidatus Erwinia haradaeae]|uniref:Cytochrome bo(3) ubiquinol oxidase subunit 4 n=1 Tax=Candidatus Erwinia haradaeae TaxID=1922217 RepID=A0A451D3A7_9GAMM|nr:cytochrome o ubiquinol oxidase subunit IV [Candidatus Erwinia haradaeae]VFP80133.1 Cytochrome bo(3) ubiquinol oxidase subunit 4 [Candidatus Erwinia haradaeae]